MLDSANYNTATVTIGKSVTILAIPGAVGSVVAIAGPAISITAAGLTVALRNLVIVPFPSAGGTEGVLMTGASALTIEHCLIANAPNNGVVILGTGKVSITDSIIRNNGLWSVSLQDGARADISATKMLNNGQGGVYAASLTATTTVATIGESVIAGGAEGLVAYGAVSGGIARIMATRTTIQNTLYPLDSTATASGSASLIAISGMMVTNNVYGWYMNGGGAVIRSLGNNHLVDNGMNFGTLTPAPQQ